MNTAVKVVIVIALIVVGTVAMLGVAGVLIARHIRVQETGTSDKKTVNIDTPFGHMSVHENKKLNPEQVGIPIYPGASRATDQGGADFQFDAGELHKDVTIAGAVYTTDDPPEKVRDFYSQKFPGWKHTWTSGGDFNIEAHVDGNIRSISIKRDSDHTRIAVASVGPPAAN